VLVINKNGLKWRPQSNVLNLRDMRANDSLLAIFVLGILIIKWDNSSDPAD